MKITRKELRQLIHESGLNTTWDMGDRVISLQDLTYFLNNKSRPVITISARKLKTLLKREITGIDPRRVKLADISVPIIVKVDRETRQPIVILDGNHRLTKAIVMGTDIPLRVLYSDEYDEIFNK